MVNLSALGRKNQLSLFGAKTVCIGKQKKLGNKLDRKVFRRPRRTTPRDHADEPFMLNRLEFFYADPLHR
jgi:hypothetical protein